MQALFILSTINVFFHRQTIEQHYFMTSSRHQSFPSALLTTFSGTILFIVCTTTVNAVQPMSESDLEFVSATTGSNILNIFGASQAGLKIDDTETQEIPSSSAKLETEKYQEGEATNPIAQKELNAIEEGKLQKSNTIPEFTIPQETENSLIKSNLQTTGNASVFSTSSEIKYKTTNVHHEMKTIENGGVSVSRDLQIDLLKLENLSGDQIDNSRSAGSIYLSNWNSQGDTRIFNTK